MMNFYKKSVHSLLAFTATSASPPSKLPEAHNHPPSKCGLGLIASTSLAATGSHGRSCPNILERAPPPPPQPAPKKIGFIDEIGGGAGVDGMMSCTESLGFESYSERRSDDDRWIEEEGIGRWRMSKKKRSSRGVNKNFPPPISSLNSSGQPSFFLQPTRRDGRLELAQVKIQRTEILRASRQDGRLRLQLVDQESDRGINAEGEPEREEFRQELQESDQEFEKSQGSDHREIGEIDRDCEEIQEHLHETLAAEELHHDDDGDGGDEWRLSRCHELVRDHHHHHGQHSTHHYHQHFWSQRRVTTR